MNANAPRRHDQSSSRSDLDRAGGAEGGMKGGSAGGPGSDDAIATANEDEAASTPASTVGAAATAPGESY